MQIKTDLSWIERWKLGKECLGKDFGVAVIYFTGVGYRGWGKS